MLPALVPGAEATINSVLAQAKTLIAASPSVDNVDRSAEMIEDIGRVLAIYDSDIDAHDQTGALDTHDLDYTVSTAETLGWRYQLNDLRSQLQKKIEDFRAAPLYQASETSAFFGSLTDDASRGVDYVSGRISDGLQILGVGAAKTAAEAAEEGKKLTATIRTVLIILAVALGFAAIVGVYVYLGE